jgi:hypothetical protein
VRGVEVGIAKPRWPVILIRNWIWKLPSKEKRESVFEPARCPFDTDVPAVLSETKFVSSPHLHRRVILPTIRWVSQSEVDLLTLNPLLAKPTVVKALGGV